MKLFGQGKRKFTAAGNNERQKEDRTNSVKSSLLGTFPKAFPKRQLPKGIFPNENFLTVKFPKR